MNAVQKKLAVVQAEIAGCRACPKMIGPPVHGGPIDTKLFLVGQAPGPREASFGRPFAWTAGRTLFSWFERALGVSEQQFRDHVYLAAVARCFPGKASGGGDRKPDPTEIERCSDYLDREVRILKPRLFLPVGTMAIEQVLGHKGPLVEVVGKVLSAKWHGVTAEVICLPHPSGASTWHRMEPGKSLLEKALAQVAEHPEVRRTFALEPIGRAPTARPGAKGARARAG